MFVGLDSEVHPARFLTLPSSFGFYSSSYLDRVTADGRRDAKRDHSSLRQSATVPLPSPELAQIAQIDGKAERYTGRAYRRSTQRRQA